MTAEGSDAARLPINEFLLGLCAVVMILLPVNTVGLTGSYVALFAITGFVLGIRFGFRLPPAIVLSLLVMAFLFVLEVASRGFGWHLREYILPLTWCIFLLNLPRVDLIIVLRVVLSLAGVAIVVDFLSLYLGFFPETANFIRDLTYGGDIREYWERYWRHAGVRGNPNSSAFLYGTYLVIYSFVVIHGSHRMPRVHWWILGLTAAITFVLLVEAESRTNLIATGVIVGISVLGIKRARLRYLLLAIIGAAIAYFYTGFEIIEDRFSNFASGTARLRHWEAMLATMDVSDMFVGRPLPFAFTDSDYLYVFTRYGAVGSIVFCLIIVWLWMAADRSNAAGRLASQLLGYSVIAGLAMGVFVSPNDAAFIFLLVYSCIAAKALSKEDSVVQVV